MEFKWWNGGRRRVLHDVVVGDAVDRDENVGMEEDVGRRRRLQKPCRPVVLLELGIAVVIDDVDLKLEGAAVMLRQVF